MIGSHTGVRCCCSFCITLVTLCGTPHYSEGPWPTGGSWQRASEIRLQWWTRVLNPILKQFVAAARGRVDARFWRSIYKQENHSGGPYVTGWIPLPHRL